MVENMYVCTDTQVKNPFTPEDLPLSNSLSKSSVNVSLGIRTQQIFFGVLRKRDL